MWENLNLSSSGHGYTLLKIVGIAVVLGVLGLAYKAYKARTGGSSVSQKTHEPSRGLGITAPSSISSSSVQTSEAEKKSPLPYGIQEWQVEEMIQIFTTHFKTFENPEIAASMRKDPMKVAVGCTDVERICKKLDQYNHIFDYLKEEGVINSYEVQRVNHFEVVLSEKFVQALKAPSSISTYEQLFANGSSSTAPSSISSLSVQTSEAEKKSPLPNRVQKWQVKEMIQIFTELFKAWENPVSSASLRVDPMKKPVARITVSCTDVERICKELHQYNDLFDYLKEQEVISSYKFLRMDACEVVLSEKFVQTLKASSSISTNKKLFANDSSSTATSASSSSMVASQAIAKKQLPNGIKEENIKACLDYINDNRYKNNFTYDEAALIGFDAQIPGYKVAEFTRGVDEWNYNTFFNYLVKEGYIKKYHIAGRNYQTFVWM